jgi:hypothetical protein
MTAEHEIIPPTLKPPSMQDRRGAEEKPDLSFFVSVAV